MRDSGRQSSGGRSLFSRSKAHKDRGEKRNGQDDTTLVPVTSHGSTTNSQSSRHGQRASVTAGRETTRPGSPSGLEQNGISLNAGLITSIPYDSTNQDIKAPIPVDYLPKVDDRTARREPTPHDIGKNGRDFHQYPNFSANAPANGSSHPSGPRPPPSASARSLHPDRPSQSVQYDPRSSSLPQESGDGPAHAYQILSSSERRLSGDQVSIYSTFSSTSQNTAGPYGNSSLNHPQTLEDKRSSHLHNPSTDHARRSHRNLLQTQQATGFSSTTSFTPDGFSLKQPTDDRVIEEAFISLMHKRGWQNLPEQARRQMLAYPPAKKWTLVHQDRLTEWQGEQKRKQQARQTGFIAEGGGMLLLSKADETGSPEWYVKRIMNDRDPIKPKELQDLSVSLRTQPLGWVRSFVEAQGQVALTNVLSKLNRRQAQGPAPNQGLASDRDLDREYDILKCLKALMNNRYGADDALAHQQVVVALGQSLISPRLSTRKLVCEMLTFLGHWGNGAGHLKVLQGLDHVKTVVGENGRFDAWMRILEVSIDGRGKMGSLVGASEEMRSGGIGMENLLMEYAVASLFLINTLIDAPERDLQLRCHIRAQFTSCGIRRILTKMEGFQYEVIDKQIERYRNNEAIDYEDLLERDNSSTKDSIDGEVKDMHDPGQVVDAIMSKIKGTRTQDYFVSAMQHLLLMRDNDSEDRLRLFQLVDAMMSYVAMDRRLPDMDLKQSLGFSVQSLMDRLHTDSEARQAVEEATLARQHAESAIAERDGMKAEVDLGADGLVAKLQKQIVEQGQMIEMQKRKAHGLRSELQELQRVHVSQQQRNELETRELYLMLRDAQNAAASSTTKGKGNANHTDPSQTTGILNRERLMERLETQLERQKTQFKLEGKVWQNVAPSNKLRELREQMDEEAEGSSGQTEYKAELMRDISSGSLGSFTRARSGVLKGSRDKTSREQRVESTIEEDTEVESDGTGDDPRVQHKLPDKSVERKPLPQLAPRHPVGLLGEIAAKVRGYDVSDEEDGGDGVTTGPSHPSLESESPKTPVDEPSNATIGAPALDSKGHGTQSGDMLEPSDGASPEIRATGAGLALPAPPPAPPPPPPPPLPDFLLPSALRAEKTSAHLNTGVPPPPAPPLPPMLLSPTGGAFPSLPQSLASPIPGAPPLPGPLSGGFLPMSPLTPVSPIIGLPVIRPKRKLKALHWEKVDTPQVTIWASHAPDHAAKEEKYMELSRKGILDEVEKLFLAKETRKLGMTSGKKDEKKQIISSDLMRKFQISLAKFSSYSVEKVVQLVIHCDTEVLNNSVVLDFLSRDDLCNIPESTTKHMAMYSVDWTGPNAGAGSRESDPQELTREDQIFLHTAFELHHYWKARTRALILTRTYESEYDTITAKLQEVVQVSESLRDSVALMNVLGLILDLGNFMNDSNKQATGFKLSSLARLGMVKDEKNESTFADLVERIIRNQYPEWEHFVDDIGGVVGAQKLNVQQLEIDGTKFMDNIANVQSSLDSGNLSDPKKFHPQDRVAQVVSRHMKEARRKAEQMQEYLEDMKKTYNDILVFYGEDAADDNARREFFPKLAAFVLEWRKSREKNLVLEETWKRNEVSMRRKQTNGIAAGVLASVGAPDSLVSPTNSGAMDSLLEKLRAAAPQARDQRDRRKRARLKERNQQRVASGQEIPELPQIQIDEEPQLRGGDANAPGLAKQEVGENLTVVSEGEDIADRAASMLQGLRGSSEAVSKEKELESSSSLRIRRRRDNADDERRARRRRRGQDKGSDSMLEDGGDGGDEGERVQDPEVGGNLSAVVEEGETAQEEVSGVPQTLVSPPSPEGS